LIKGVGSKAGKSGLRTKKVNKEPGGEADWRTAMDGERWQEVKDQEGGKKEKQKMEGNRQ
jgi:hypothetical protein